MARLGVASVVVLTAFASGEIAASSLRSAPTPVAPIQDAIIYSQLPDLTWLTVPPTLPEDTIQYELRVAPDSGFATSADIDSLSDTSYSLYFPLEPARRYWWKVISRDNHDDTSVSTTESFRTYMPGDVNETWDVSSADIIAIVGFVFKGAVLDAPQCAANVNDDSTVSSADIIHLVNHVFRGGIMPSGNCLGEMLSEDWLPLLGNLEFYINEQSRTSASGDIAYLPYAVWTDYRLPCANYELQVDLSVTQSAIRHGIEGILKPEICLTMAGPAIWNTQPTLDTGVYEIRFEHGFLKDQWQLQLTDSSLRLTAVDTAFTHAIYTLMWRRPHKSMAVVLGATLDLSWVCDDFLDSLHAHMSLTEHQFPDSGVVPYPRSSGHVGYDPPAQYLIYPSETDWDVAVAVMDAYIQNVVEPLNRNLDIHIWIYNWDGRLHRFPQ